MDDSQVDQELSKNVDQFNNWPNYNYYGFQNNEAYFWDDSTYQYASPNYFFNSSSQIQNGIAEIRSPQPLVDNYFNKNYCNYYQNNYNFDQNEDQYYQRQDLIQNTFSKNTKTTPFIKNNLSQYYDRQDLSENRVQMMPSGYGYNQREQFLQNRGSWCFTSEDTKNFELGQMTSKVSWFPPFGFVSDSEAHFVEERNKFSIMQPYSDFK